MVCGVALRNAQGPAILRPAPTTDNYAQDPRCRALSERRAGRTVGQPRSGSRRLRRERSDETRLTANGSSLTNVALLRTTAMLAKTRGFAAQTGDKVVPLSLIKRSEEHTSELQSLMRISYAVFCLK